MAHNHEDDRMDRRSQNGRLAGQEEALGAGGDGQKNARREQKEQKAAHDEVVHFYSGRSIINSQRN